MGVESGLKTVRRGKLADFAGWAKRSAAQHSLARQDIGARRPVHLGYRKKLY